MHIQLTAKYQSCKFKENLYDFVFHTSDTCRSYGMTSNIVMIDYYYLISDHKLL